MTGDAVDIVVAERRVQKAIGEYIQVVLFKLGFDPRLKAAARRRAGPRTCRTRATASRSGSRSGSQQYPAPSDVLDGLLGCDSFVPDSDASPNISGFCDRTTVQPLMQRAEALGVTRPQAAERLWRQVDRHITDLAVWLPLVQSEADRPRVAARAATTAGARSRT